MPFTSDEVIEKLENKIREIASVTEMLEQGMTPEQILEEILGDFGLEISDKIPAAFECDCSKERVSRAISTLSKKDLDSICLLYTSGVKRTVCGTDRTADRRDR